MSGIVPISYINDLNVFRCKASPGSCAAGTQFPELDHKGSDLVLKRIPVANVLIYREDGFMVSMVCGVILGILESGGYFSWKSFLCYSFWRENTLFVKYVYTGSSSWKCPCFASMYSFLVFSEGIVSSLRHVSLITWLKLPILLHLVEKQDY